MRKMMAVVVALSSALAFAGKEEREFKKTEVEPAIKASQEAFKKNCGCELKWTVDWDAFKTKDEMRQIRNSANNIAEETAAYCSDAETKAVVCKSLKEIAYTKGSESVVSVANGKGTITSDGQSYVNWTMISREVDK